MRRSGGRECDSCFFGKSDDALGALRKRAVLGRQVLDLA
jgi:hypothetical protein